MITTIELPIYELDIVCLIEQDWENSNRKHKLNLDNDCLSAHAVTTLLPYTKQRHEIYLLLKPNYLDYNTLGHELHHLINYICIAKGIQPDAENDESLAYLSGYLSQQIFEFRDKYLRNNLTKVKP